MGYNNHDIRWTCPTCEHAQAQEMHSDPNAHFVSAVCVECEGETETCPCELGIIVDLDEEARQVYSRMGKKSAEARKGKTDYSDLAKKRWQK